MLEALLEALLDSVKLLPFLFLTYLVMEWLEYKTEEKTENMVAKADKFGPLWGGILGVVPQCGFSAAATSLYAGRVITVGTLIAIYLSTSDEMLPIMISASAPVATIVKVLVAKMLIGIVTGFIIEYVSLVVLKRDQRKMDIHHLCEQEHCKCEDGIFMSALKHTLKIFAFIVVISLVINILITLVGEENLAGIFTSVPVVGELIAGLVGLIPNCVASVVITQLYLDGIIHAGAMMSGLLVSAGVGLLILFRLNKSIKENLRIVAVLYGVSVLWGVLIELVGITF